MEHSDPATALDSAGQADYYLEVVKTGDDPAWPKGEEDLIVGSQEIGSGFTQFWAYPKESSKEAEDLPHAEVIAAEHTTDKPAILIDKYGLSDGLELVLVKDGHAWGKAESSIDNLEDNISSLLEFAKSSFKMEIGHFMTTARVGKEVEEKLDDLEDAGGAISSSPEEKKEDFLPQDEEEIAPEPETAMPVEEEKPVYGRIRPPANLYATDRSSKSSKVWIIIPIILILAAFIGALVFKDKIINKLGGGPAPTPTVTVTPSPTPSPTPTPSIDRSQYKVRVLNGTIKIGAASTLLADLKTKGWQTLSSGNATNSATPQTYVRVKKEMTQVQSTLISDLSPDLDATASLSELSATDKADAEVVIGLK